MFSNHLYAFHATLTPEGETVMPAEEWLHKWTPEEIGRWSTTSPTPTSSSRCRCR